MNYVIVFITGNGVDKAMCVAKQGYSNEDHDYILKEAISAGISRPEIIGQVEIPDEIANEMCEGRIYVG